MYYFWTALISIVVTSVVWLILTRRYFARRTQNENREVRRLLQRVMEEQNESQMMLASIDMGILAYGSDGNLISNNKTALNILGELPVKFQDFLDRFGEEESVRSSLLLGNDKAEGGLLIDDRSYRVLVRKRRLGENKREGHIIVIQDVTEREREDLRRKEFVANVSHELKTPLTIIKTYTESLLDWGLTEKNTTSVRKDITRIYDDTLRMEKLVDDLLLLSRIDGRGMQVRIQRGDLQAITRLVVERLQPQAEDKGISLSFYCLNQLPSVFIDRDAWERILLNLISNAIKYTEKPGDVKVYLGFLVDEVYLKVKDTGMGIDERDQQHIFDRFYRVDNTGSRQYGGTGLGLSIVRELVDLHLGYITVHSALAQGSEFTVMIPCAEKVLHQALYELTHHGSALSEITRAAAADLEELAESMGIVAKWTSLQSNQIADIERQIRREESPDITDEMDAKPMEG